MKMLQPLVIHWSEESNCAIDVNKIGKGFVEWLENLEKDDPIEWWKFCMKLSNREMILEVFIGPKFNKVLRKFVRVKINIRCYDVAL